MSTCCSIDCKKYKECAKANINNEGIHTCTDKANSSFVSMDSNGKYEEQYWCGEKGDYRLFEKIKKIHE